MSDPHTSPSSESDGLRLTRPAGARMLVVEGGGGIVNMASGLAANPLRGS
jgi:hypothetical protein